MSFTNFPAKEMGDGICTLGQMEWPHLSLTFLYRELINGLMPGKPIMEHTCSNMRRQGSETKGGNGSMTA